MISAIVVLVLALGGGASFVAESSVPGDPLYVVKTAVNEQVMGMISSGAEAHANWEATLATRRLNEAAELKLRGTLTDERAAKLNEEFKTHAEAAITAAHNIGSSGQDGVEVSIRSKLNAVVAQDDELFAPRDAASGQASGKVFVLPHVLEASAVGEVKSPRDSASGQATGKVVAPPPSGDVDGDGAAMRALPGSGATVEGSGGAGLKVEDSAAMKPTYDVKSMKK